MRFLLFLLAGVPAMSQGVVTPTESLRFQTINPEPKGTLTEQLERAEGKVKGRVYRYRVFVRPEADVKPFSITLRAPVLTIVRVAALPHKDQKISLEAVTSGGRNPHGLVFISGEGVTKNEATPKVAPMVTTALDNVNKALHAAQLAPADVLSLTCYISSLDDIAEVQKLTASRYPKAARNHLQIPIAFGRALVECEAVARAKGAVGFLSPEGLPKSPNFSHVAGVSAKKLYWSGVHTAPSCDEAGVRKMFQNLEGDAKKEGAALDQAAFSYLYPNSQQGMDLIRNIRFGFYSKERPPASTMILFNGVEDANACAAVEVAVPVQ
ncbi:MAG: RidA family protein [Bryobacterales bacterium]|nr:RidA family protein [Bryobacterales bacterium]